MQGAGADPDTYDRSMNLAAAVGLVPALLIGSLAWWLSGYDDIVALAVSGPIVIAIDLALRSRRRPALGAPGQWLYSPKAGGVLFMIPVWCLGVVQLGVAIARSLGVDV
jgi:hypothetical protein